MTEVERFAGALKDLASRPYGGPGSVAEGWQQLTRDALTAAGIVLTDDEFGLAWRWLWKSSFMGGSYTQDARRVLTEARRGDAS